MSLQDNSITNDEINKLIYESKYAMNSLNISFPYIYVAEAINLNWHDILFAIDKGYLGHQSAIEHAEVELGKSDTCPQAVLNLACLYPEEAVFPHSIHPYIDELSNLIAAEEKAKSQDKMMYVLLKWVYEHKDDYVDPFYAVEAIWDDFHLAEAIASITSIIWYSPSEWQELGSVEKNRARAFDRWKHFLDEQQQKWKNNPESASTNEG